MSIAERGGGTDDKPNAIEARFIMAEARRKKRRSYEVLKDAKHLNPMHKHPVYCEGAEEVPFAGASAGSGAAGCGCGASAGSGAAVCGCGASVGSGAAGCVGAEVGSGAASCGCGASASSGAAGTGCGASAGLGAAGCGCGAGAGVRCLEGPKMVAYVNGVSESVFKVGMCLPAGPYVFDSDVEYIVESIKEAMR